MSYLAAALAVTFGILFLYLFSLERKVRKLEKDLEIY